jgi:hypothetical protein
MKSPLSFFVPSAFAVLSTASLCGLNGTALSQTATGSATSLPEITVVAPKQVARPRQVARSPHRPAQTAIAATRPTAPTPQTPPPAQGSVLARIAALEKTSSNCTDGCQTSFKHGNQSWNGCSLGAGFNFSATCRNIRNFKTYSECSDYGYLLAWRPTEIWWYCSSLVGAGKYAGEKYKVAE